MKTYFTSLLLSGALSVSAFGLRMQISSPEIGHRANLNQQEQNTAKQVLEFMHKELKLIEGAFVNEFSNQRFGATSAQASAFIALLRDAGLWQVQVAFRDFGELDSAFTLSQSSAESVRLHINTAREDFRLKDFQHYLPGVENPITLVSKEEKSAAVQPATSPEDALKLGRMVIALQQALANPQAPDAIKAVTDMGHDTRYYVMVRGWLSYQLSADQSILNAGGERTSKTVKDRIAFLHKAIRAVDLEK